MFSMEFTDSERSAHFISLQPFLLRCEVVFSKEIMGEKNILVILCRKNK